MTDDQPGSEHPSSPSKHPRGDFDNRATAARHDLENQLRAQRARFEERNEKLTARTGRNLPAAIGIGAGMGAIVLLSLILFKWIFMIVAAILVFFMVLELTNALRTAGRRVPRIPSIATGLAVVPAAYFWKAEGQWLVLLGGIVVISLWRLVEAALPTGAESTTASATEGRRGGRALFKDLQSGAFVQIYTTFLGSFLALLTAQPGGQWWTLTALIVVICVDTGAYATGLNFGKHKLAPKISPGKTWEGFAGSVGVSMIAGIILSIFMIHQPWWFGLILGAVFSITATIGDLSESLIKRDLGVKDISTWLPGHGGFLDRLDSMLPSAVVAYGLYLIFTHH
ncbi:phosphatidate cytidylyltransferase [Frondihabitans cladoniiphilus]|uniref:Phosphatidate cytidylyltransferase n=1 Tax=Frondihabitans cladoniiphilus TaxID=715785 RepID=A0ABP8VJ33_9MICO